MSLKSVLEQKILDRTQHTMTNYTINLSSYRTPGSKVFTGRDRGQQDRLASNIDDLIEKHVKIQIVIPEDIYSINAPFSIGCEFSELRYRGRQKERSTRQ